LGGLVIWSLAPGDYSLTKLLDYPMPLSDYEKFVNTDALLACQRPISQLVSTWEVFFGSLV